MDFFFVSRNCATTAGLNLLVSCCQCCPLCAPRDQRGVFLDDVKFPDSELLSEILYPNSLSSCLGQCCGCTLKCFPSPCRLAYLLCECGDKFFLDPTPSPQGDEILVWATVTIDGDCETKTSLTWQYPLSASLGQACYLALCARPFSWWIYSNGYISRCPHWFPSLAFHRRELDPDEILESQWLAFRRELQHQLYDVISLAQDLIDLTVEYSDVDRRVPNIVTGPMRVSMD
jgi:hypothetical protein